MSIKKQYDKKKQVCKVTFTLPKKIANSAKNVSLVGDFNGWNPEVNPMKRRKDGAFDLTINLDQGNAYEFRYLLDGNSWENDDSADNYVPTPFGDTDNSVITL